MKHLFDLLGVLLGLYTAYSAWRGSVYGRSGAWGRTWDRDEDPRGFWSLIAIYEVLSMLLVVWF
jgi:uncharacterized BrkB/YihY/UPF0761 family membrane protein